MTTITAQIIADSIGEHSPRLTTMLLRYPRCIHAEFMTHRVFSRNAASSRAIPVEKMIKDVMLDPFIPLVWGRNQKGMQALKGYELRGMELETAKAAWRRSMSNAVDTAQTLADLGAHKQIVNRILEPFAHITVVVTATQWSNFFALRRHPDAEPHIRMLADRMWEAMEASTPFRLHPGKWHLPFVLKDDWVEICGSKVDDSDIEKALLGRAIKLSVARCASTSYKTVDGFDMTLDRAVALHDKLVGSVPLHASPCEHQAQMDEKVPGSIGPYGERTRDRWRDGRGGNLGPGWVQYRKTLAGECA